MAFLQTLTDGFTTPYPDRNTFMGACKTGGSARTQGNDFLIQLRLFRRVHRRSAEFRRFPASLSHSAARFRSSAHIPPFMT